MYEEDMKEAEELDQYETTLIDLTLMTAYLFHMYRILIKYF